MRKAGKQEFPAASSRCRRSRIAPTQFEQPENQKSLCSFWFFLVLKFIRRLPPAFPDS